MEFRIKLAAAVAWVLLTLYAYLVATRRLMRADLVLLAWVRLFLHQKARKTAIKFQIALLRKSAAKTARRIHQPARVARVIFKFYLVLSLRRSLQTKFYPSWRTKFRLRAEQILSSSPGKILLSPLLNFNRTHATKYPPCRTVRKARSD